MQAETTNDSELDIERDRAERILKAVSRLRDELSSDCALFKRYLAAGKVREIAQNFQAAARYYRQAMEDDGNASEPLARLALVLLKMGETREGLNIAEELHERAPSYRFHTITGQPVSTSTVLGDALRLNGEISAAVNAYNQAIEISDGEDLYSVSRLTSLLIDQGDLKRAMEIGDKFMAAKEFGGVWATVDLLRNNPNRLPAIQGVLDNSVGLIAADVAV